LNIKKVYVFNKMWQRVRAWARSFGQQDGAKVWHAEHWLIRLLGIFVVFMMHLLVFLA
jgi:hypothetical protein